MSDVILRQIMMLQYVPRLPRKTTAGELQEKLANIGPQYRVSKRTIERDLQKLEQQFGLVVDDSDKPFGWSFRPDAVKDIPGMDPATALAFVMAEQQLERYLPPGAMENIRPHFRLARSVLGQFDQQGLARWPEKVAILPRGVRLSAPEIDPQVMQVVYDGVLHERCIRVDYRTRAGALREAQVLHPLGLVLRDTLIYLVCRYPEDDKQRQLLLHRMSGARLLADPIQRPDGFRLPEWVRSSGFVFGKGGRIRLRARFFDHAGTHLLETPLTAEQQLTEEQPGVHVLDAEVDDNAELRWWLQAFGLNVEVLAPAALRGEMADSFARLHQRYSDTAD